MNNLILDCHTSLHSVRNDLFIICNFYLFLSSMDLLSFKTTFDGILQTYVQGKIEQAQKLISDKKINKFIDYITTFIFSG